MLPRGASRDDAVIAVSRKTHEHTALSRGDKRVFDENTAADMLSYDPTRPASFPSNGRTLTDDVADAFLAVLTNGKVTGDKVGPTSICLPSSPIWGRRTTASAEPRNFVYRTSFARRPGAGLFM